MAQHLQNISDFHTVGERDWEIRTESRGTQIQLRQTDQILCDLLKRERAPIFRNLQRLRYSVSRIRAQKWHVSRCKNESQIFAEWYRCPPKDRFATGTHKENSTSRDGNKSVLRNILE